MEATGQQKTTGINRSTGDITTTCPWCSKTFTDPKSLPCLHSFCLACLENFVENVARCDNGDSYCPICYDLFPIPEGGLVSLRTSPFVAKAVSAKTLSDRSTERHVDCQLCTGEAEPRDATAFCAECNEAYCADCADYHGRLKATRDHHLVELADSATLTDSMTRYAPRYCDEHDGKHVDMYCERCCRPICVLCYSTSHRRHHWISLTEALDRAKNRMTADDELLADAFEGLDKSRSDVERQRAEFVDKVSQIEEQISRTAEELKEAVESHKRALLAGVAARKQEIVEGLDDVVSESTLQLSFIDTLRDYGRRLSANACDVDLVSESHRFHRQSVKLAESKASDILKGSVGTIHVDFAKLTMFAELECWKNAIGDVRMTVCAKGQSVSPHHCYVIVDPSLGLVVSA